MEEEPGSRGGSRPSGVIRVPPTPLILKGLTPGPSSNDRVPMRRGFNRCRVVGARESMIVAHVHTEVEKPRCKQRTPSAPR